MAQDYGAAQPIADWVNKYVFGKPPKKAAPAKAQTMNWTPEANEEQKREISGTKPLSKRNLGVKTPAKKRTRKPVARKR